MKPNSLKDDENQARETKKRVKGNDNISPAVQMNYTYALGFEEKNVYLS